MNFGFDEQQDLLRSEARKFLDGQAPLSEVRRIAETEDGFSREQWKQLAELGWLGLVVPEECGGVGLGWVDLMVLLEEVGRTLHPSPLLSTLLTAATLVDLAEEGQRERLVGPLVEGTRIGTLALFDRADVWTSAGITLTAEPDGDVLVLRGNKPFVADAPAADLYLVAYRTGDSDADIGLAVVDADAPGVRCEVRAGIDATKRHGTLVLDGVRIEPDNVLGAAGAVWPVLELARDRAATGLCAEMIGASEGLLAMTVQYAKDRQQFGSPIGRYQGVKHPLAEAYVDIECMKSLTYYAAWALDESSGEVPAAVAKAKGFASEAFNRIGIAGIQLHGAIGYTEANDVHLYLRRSKWARPAWGGEEFHYERAAALGGL
jgi:alkylation response protein AidB-like acyl-CoA dehydrogenase